jgi:hypothetical protein
MKKLLILLFAFCAFGALKGFVAKYQMHDAGMTVANNESCGDSMGGGPKRS